MTGAVEDPSDLPKKADVSDGGVLEAGVDPPGVR